MENANDSFEKDLEQLIRLFKKIKAKTDAGQFAHLDPAFMQNLDFMINNFEMFKHNIPKDMFEQMGFPIQKLLKEFINQLKNELGEDELIETQELSKEKSELINDIEKIDMMLNLSSVAFSGVNLYVIC